MNCFLPAKGTHQVAYGLEGVWSLTSVGSTGVDGSGVVVFFDSCLTSG